MANHGGKRKGAGSGGKRPGAGRKQVKFNFGSIGDSFVMERGIINEVPRSPEVWEVVTVTDEYFELQRTIGRHSEIITISKIDYWNGE